jgi:hypothetical protein
MTTTPGLATRIMSDSTSAPFLGPSSKRKPRIPEPLRCIEGKYPAERFLAIMTMMPDLKHASAQLRERAAEHLERLQWEKRRYHRRNNLNPALSRCRNFLFRKGCPSNLYTLIGIMIYRIQTGTLTDIPWSMRSTYTDSGYDVLESLIGNVVPANEDESSGSEDDHLPGMAHGIKRQGSALADMRGKKSMMDVRDAILQTLTCHEAKTALAQRRFRRKVEKALKKGFAGHDGQLQADIASHDHAQGGGNADFHNEIAGREDGALQNQAIEDSDSHILRAVYQDNGYIADGEEELEDVDKNQAVQGGAGRMHDWLQELGEGYAGGDEQDVVIEN